MRRGGYIQRRTPLSRKAPISRKTPLRVPFYGSVPNSRPGAKSKATRGIRRQSKQPISVIQRKLWVLCKQIIRQKYGNTCYTCLDTGLVGSNWQTGHMIAKASLGAYLKYDLRLLRPQCARCNLWEGGQGALFITRMREIEGYEYVDSILEDRKISVKAYDHYAKLLEEYQKLLIPLSSTAYAQSS